MNANDRNPYATAARRRRPLQAPLFVWSDGWIVAMLLLAGPLFGTLAALGPAVGDARTAMMFGTMFGLGPGVLLAPFVYMLVRHRRPWVVALIVLVPASFAAFIGGRIGMRMLPGSVAIAVPLTALVYIASAAAVHYRWPLPRKGRCVQCGYTLKGLTRGICPECGERFVTEP